MWSQILAAAASLLIGGCMADNSSNGGTHADARRGELAARVSDRAVAATSPTTGLRKLTVRGSEPMLLYVPESYRHDRPMPLVLMLHGAGGVPRESIDLVRRHADTFGFIILAPGSQAATWDIIAKRAYGTDVAAIDTALAQVFEDYAVDRGRIAVAGFSDGASYALSLGLTNGSLFSHVIAFSPGFMAPAREQGKPRIFISHGVQDRVLPIEQCSRRLVPSLKRRGYEVSYTEFPDGHIVPTEIAAKAFSTLG